VLPEEDIEFLTSKGYDYTVTPEGGELTVVIANFPFPSAYTPRTAEMLIRLVPGYPNSKPDMFWTIPDVKLTSGAYPDRAEHKENYLGRTWQRWSRHWGSEWQPGVDGLQTFIGAIVHELNRGR
jgi:hypothetical protein